MTEDRPIAVGIRKVSRTVRFAVVEVFERRLYLKTRAGTVEHIHRTSVITATMEDRDAAVTDAKLLSLLLEVPYLAENIDLL